MQLVQMVWVHAGGLRPHDRGGEGVGVRGQMGGPGGAYDWVCG